MEEKIRSKTRKLRRIIKQKKLPTTFARDLSMPVSTSKCVCVCVWALSFVFSFLLLVVYIWLRTLVLQYAWNRILYEWAFGSLMRFNRFVWCWWYYSCFQSNQIKSHHIFILHTHTNTPMVKTDGKNLISIEYCAHFITFSLSFTYLFISFGYLYAR